MRALIATAIAFATTVASSATLDPQAGEPEGERVALWPEGKVPGMEEHQYDSPFIEWFTPSNRTTDAVLVLTCGDFRSLGSAKGPFTTWWSLMWEWLVQMGMCRNTASP